MIYYSVTFILKSTVDYHALQVTNNIIAYLGLQIMGESLK